MFYSLRHKGNANQNYTMIPSHSSQNGYQGNKQQYMLARMGVGRNPYTMLVEKQISLTTMEINNEVPQQ
jgi:hypothetical protein